MYFYAKPTRLVTLFLLKNMKTTKKQNNPILSFICLHVHPLDQGRC